MAEQEKEKQHQDKRQPQREESIVRISGRDINGSFRMEKALTRVKGIGNSMAHSLAVAISSKYGISSTQPIGEFTEEQIEKVEQAIKAPEKHGIPDFMLNRRMDGEDGSDAHLTGNDLIIKVRQDIERDIKNQTWRGYRHQYGQKVRGQRNRSTGRTGATIGVTKKKGLVGQAAQAGAAAEQQKSQTKPAASKK